MKAVVLTEATVIAGRLRQAGEVVWVDDAFVVGAQPIFLSDQEVVQSTFSELIDNFIADLASGKITVTGLGKGLYLITEWTKDVEGDDVALSSLTIKLKTVRAAKAATQDAKTAVAAKYQAQIDQLNALIVACGG